MTSKYFIVNNTINISNLSEGIYFARITSVKGNVVVNYKINSNGEILVETELKNIDENLFGNYMNYTEFAKYKIYFIIDGNIIASNHMYGFYSGSVPFVISHPDNKFWFHDLIPSPESF